MHALRSASSVFALAVLLSLLACSSEAGARDFGYRIGTDAGMEFDIPLCPDEKIVSVALTAAGRPGETQGVQVDRVDGSARFLAGTPDRYGPRYGDTSDLDLVFVTSKGEERATLPYHPLPDIDKWHVPGSSTPLTHDELVSRIRC